MIKLTDRAGGSFDIEPLQTLIDLQPCAGCGTYCEALPGDGLCHVCSQSVEIKQVMYPHHPSAMVSLSSDDVVDYEVGGLVDIEA